MRWCDPHGHGLGYAVASNRALGRIGFPGGFGGEAAVLQAVCFGFGGGIDDELRVDDHAAVFGGFWRNALGGECWAENWDQGWCDVRAESCADCEGTGVWHPVACIGG
jgi:hypothetical protein